jgi:hypothetical protein
MKKTIDEAKAIIESKILRRSFKIHYRKGLCGCVYWDSKLAYIPEIKTRKSLYIASHELFHALRDRKGKVYIDEYKAEVFAHRFLRHLGYSVPRSMTQRAKGYITRKIGKALRRGMKAENIDTTIKTWIK